MIVTAELVRQLVDAQFPRFVSMPLEAVVPGGWDNRTFRLGDTLSVRLPSAARYASQVEKEHRWLPELARQLPFAIPTPLEKGAPTDDYPWPWSIYRWLEGKPATNATEIDDPAFARSLAAFLTALYRIDTTGRPAAGSHNFHRGGLLAVYDEETQSALLALSGKLDAASTGNVWATALLSEWRSQPVWVHGDIAAGNLLVKDRQLSAVIDFGCSAIGDPACDLVIAWTEFGNASRTIFRSELPFDDDTWRRARGWALWKALITVRSHTADASLIKKAYRTIAAILEDHRRDTL